MALVLDGTAGITYPDLAVQSKGMANASSILTTIGTRGVTAPYMPAGAVLQVLQSGTSTGISTTSGTPQATALSVTITPTSATSKIMIFYSLGGVSTNYTSGGSGGIKVWIYKNGSALNQNGNQWQYPNAQTGYKIGSGGSVSYDSPATTSATTYAIYWASQQGSAGIVCEIFRDNTTGYLIVMEVAQ